MLLEDEKLSYSLFRRNNSLFWRKHFPVLICREFVRKTLKLIRELMSKIAKPAKKSQIPCSQFATGLCRTCRA